MIWAQISSSLCKRSLSRPWREERAAQIVEFAVALPLLMVFVVGIFDFSGAFTLKQKLTNVARDAARAAASDPANDLTGFSTLMPVSVGDAFQLVNNYLIANKINTCGLAPGGSNVGPLWTFTATGGGCPTTGLTLIINRGYYFPQTGGTLPTVACTPQNSAGQIAVAATCVSIQYGYAWRFGRVARLLGSQDTLPQQISAVAVSMNEN